MLTGNSLFVSDVDDNWEKVLKAILAKLWLLHSAMNSRDLGSSADRPRRHERVVGMSTP